MCAGCSCFFLFLSLFSSPAVKLLNKCYYYEDVIVFVNVLLKIPMKTKTKHKNEPYTSIDYGYNCLIASSHTHTIGKPLILNSANGKIKNKKTTIAHMTIDASNRSLK